ncbi:MAG: SCP2 sterol-binding domain-containing protein [Lachnospiraceae bacterium]|nr:SCP2 sterol-binding domain-containing protein [Lachnospiraceae bacterium]
MTYHEFVQELREIFNTIDASAIEEHFAIQLNIVGEAEGALYIEFADGAIDVQPYEYYDRDLIINADFETALDIVSGEIELAEAFAEEKIEVWGDFDKAIEIFSIILGMNKKAKPKKTTKKG